MIISKLRNNKVWLSNAFYLSLVNVINYLLPLVLIPFLLSKLELALFGKYVTSQAILGVGIMLVNFGFDFSAVKLISINRYSKDVTTRILRNVALCKLILYGFFIFGVFFVEYLGIIDPEVIWFVKHASLYVVFFSLIPNFFFHGIEKMKYLVLITGTQKVIFFLLCFLLIKSPEDYYTLPLYMTISSIISFSLSLAVITFLIRSENSCDERVNIENKEKVSISIASLLKGSINLFLSTFFMSSYRELNIIFIKMFSTFEIVAIYSLSEKVIKGVQGLLSPITKSLFPNFSRDINTSQGKSRFIRFTKLYFLFLSFVAILLYFSSDSVANMFMQKSAATDIDMLVLFIKVMSPVIIFGGLNYTLGIIGLVNMGKEKQFTVSVFFSAFFSVVMVFAMGNIIPDFAGPVAFLSAEVFLFVLLSIFFIRGKLWT